jgi:hypothetical protein
MQFLSRLAKPYFLRSYQFGHERIRPLLDLPARTGITFSRSSEIFSMTTQNLAPGGAQLRRLAAIHCFLQFNKKERD